MLTATHLVGILTSLVVVSAAPTEIVKRGSGKAGISWPVQEISADPVALFFAGGSQLTWWHDWNKNWNTVLPGTSPSTAINAEFIPTMYTVGDATNNIPLQPGYTAIAGYNEPERQGIDFGAAASDWSTNIVPKRSSSVKLISPTVANDAAGQQWLINWFNQICPGSSGTTGYAGCANAPDYVGVNVYSKDFTTFQGMIEYYHNTHGLPIVVKEFAADDFSGIPLPLNEVQSFMSQATQWLDSTSWVVKYAWFGAVRNSAWLYGVSEVNRLMDASGNITPLGQQYIGGGSI